MVLVVKQIVVNEVSVLLLMVVDPVRALGTRLDQQQMPLGNVVYTGVVHRDPKDAFHFEGSEYIRFEGMFPCLLLMVG